MTLIRLKILADELAKDLALKSAIYQAYLGEDFIPFEMVIANQSTTTRCIGENVVS